MFKILKRRVIYTEQCISTKDEAMTENKGEKLDLLLDETIEEVKL